MGINPAKTNEQMDVNMDTSQSNITDSTWETEEEMRQSERKANQRPCSITGNENHETCDMQMGQVTPDAKNHQEVDGKAEGRTEDSEQGGTPVPRNETERESGQSDRDTSDAGVQQEAEDKTQGQNNAEARAKHEKGDKKKTQDDQDKKNGPLNQDRQSRRENPHGQEEKEKLKILTERKQPDSPTVRPELQAQWGARACLEESVTGQNPPTPQTDNRQSRPKIPGLSNNRQQPANSNVKTRNDQGQTKPRAQVKEQLNPNQQKSIYDTTKRKTLYTKNQHIQEMDQQSVEAAGVNQPQIYGYGVDYYGQGAGISSQGHSTARYQGDRQEHGWQRRQDQMQGQIIREAQASKQMVYGVYGNCITMLEEMEQRELRKTGGKAMSRSDIYLPDQSKFDDNTIKRKMDTQLVLLQAQLTSCHDAIRDEVKDELKANTLHWSSAREAKKIPHGLTDKYAEKMFGLLETGTTKHPKEFHQPPTIDERGMQKALGAILHGNQKRADLDRSFKDDRNKKATGPRIRQSAGIDQGVDRLVKGNPKYEKAANNYRESLR